MRNLIIYSTTDGQTISISKKIGQLLKNCEIVSTRDAEALDLNIFDTIIIGASIRYGKHKPELYSFIKKNHEVLSTKKNAFFSVNVVARKAEKNTPETNPYMQKFLKISEWSPQNLEVFAGKIAYPDYGFIDKHMIRFIMWMTKGPTDLNCTYEFTNWDSVDNFANKIGSIN